MNDQLFESSSVQMQMIFARIGARMQAPDATKAAEENDPTGERLMEAFRLCYNGQIALLEAMKPHDGKVPDYSTSQVIYDQRP